MALLNKDSVRPPNRSFMSDRHRSIVINAERAVSEQGRHGEQGYDCGRKPERALVRRVREYLDENYADNITLDHLAQMVNLSAFHLNRIFKSEVGLPPHAYQTQVRVMRGKSLLAQGMAIDQVAVEVGFFDQSHFTNHFKRLFTYTPGIYQKNILGK
jgi:AraC-like DNA-binding protein